MESVSGVKGLTMKMPNNDQDKIFSQSLEKGGAWDGQGTLFQQYHSFLVTNNPENILFHRFFI